MREKVRKLEIQSVRKDQAFFLSEATLYLAVVL